MQLSNFKFGRLGAALLLTALGACTVTSSQPEGFFPESTMRPEGDVPSTHWLQPKEHSEAALAAAYNDGILDEQDATYWEGAVPTEMWLQAPLRSGKAREHGYRESWVDVEFLVVEQNSRVTEIASGVYPSKYAIPILEEVRKGTVKVANCDAAHLRFHDTGWIPPGLYPSRNMSGRFVGHAKMVVSEIEGERYPQAILPLNGGVAVVVVPTHPIEHQPKPGGNPQVTWGVIHNGEQVPLEFLPGNNTTNRVVGTPANPERGRSNALLENAAKGASLAVAIVKPGVCGANARNASSG